MKVKLSTPRATAIARWMMDGNCSTTNALIARAGESILNPAGVGFSYLCFDAFGACQGHQSDLVVVGPKLLVDKARGNPGMIKLWRPVFEHNSFTSLVIRPPFDVNIFLNPSIAKPEAFAAMEEELKNGLEAEINRTYTEVVKVTESLITRCMQLLLLDDERAIVSYLNEPASLFDLALTMHDA